jgi:hypothetical protein
MPEMLTRDDQDLMARLLARTGLLSSASERDALLIEMDVREDISLDGPPHASAVILIDRLVNVGNFLALRTMLLRISSRMHAAADADLARLQQMFGLTENDLAQTRPSRPLPIPSMPVVDGLNALSTLTTRDTRIRDAAARFGAVFEMARGQIQNVAGYKGLHDQLHDLAQKVEAPMEKLAPDFPENEEAAFELQEYRIIFEEINRQLHAIAGRFSLADTGWITALDQALRNLALAVQNRDAQTLKQVIKEIKRQLTMRLPQINARLNAAATTLRLSDLVRALSDIRDTAEALGNDASRLQRFRSGVETLDRMEKNLTALVKHHDLWQEFDVQLRAMESNLEDLSGWWRDVNDLVQKIGDSYGNVPWMCSFVAECNGLQTAIDSGEPRRVSQGYRLLRRQVGIRFYKTDADLMSQCGELSSVGEALMRVIE